MTKDEFLRLFKYMEDFREETSLKFEATSTSFDNINNRLDSIEAGLKLSEDERLVMAHQLNQVYDWTQIIASKIGYDLQID